MWRLIIIISAVLIAGCNNYESPMQDGALPDATTIGIGDLHNLCGHRTLDITDNIVIGGYVTSSDRASNFYKTFTLEDATGGVEIRRSSTNLKLSVSADSFLFLIIAQE